MGAQKRLLDNETTGLCSECGAPLEDNGDNEGVLICSADHCESHRDRQEMLVEAP